MTAGLQILLLLPPLLYTVPPKLGGVVLAAKSKLVALPAGLYCGESLRRAGELAAEPPVPPLRGVVAGTAAAGVGVVAIEGLFPEGGLLLGFPEGFLDLGALSCCCCCCFCCCLHLALRFLNHTCTLDSGKLIFIATSSRINISGYLVFENKPSRTSNCARVKVVLSLRCFLGLQ